MRSQLQLARQLLAAVVFLGSSLSILLLVSSIGGYRYLSRQIVIYEVRRDLGKRATTVERELQRSLDRGKLDFASALQKQTEEHGKPAWVDVRSAQGTLLAHAGSPSVEPFTPAEVHESLRQREPLFRTVQTAQGEVLAEAFPLHVRPHVPADGNKTPATPAWLLPGFGAPEDRRQGGPHLEIAIALSDVQAQFWPLRLSLLINCSAAFALFASVMFTARKFKDYVKARQVQQQVELAREVQQAFLPKTDRIANSVHVAGECVPALQVGGDFYDAYPAGESTALVLGDVSGKGVPAALLAGLLYGAIRMARWVEGAAEHEAATAELNRLLLERASGERYATLFWCYYEQASQRLYYINAGHCPPLLVRANGETVSLDRGGTVLGLLGGMSYRQEQVELGAGDLLLIFSDGIVEAANGKDEQFGEERLAELLRCYRKEPIEALRERITAAVKVFVGSMALQDDLTFVVARFEGAPAGLGDQEAVPSRLLVG